jgi:hypothetical protein
LIKLVLLEVRIKGLEGALRNVLVDPEVHVHCDIGDIAGRQRRGQRLPVITPGGLLIVDLDVWVVFLEGINLYFPLT